MDLEPTPPISQTPPSPAEVPTKAGPVPSRKFPSLPLLLALLALLALLSSTLYLFYQNMQLQKQLDRRVTEKIQPTPTPTTSAIADWKMYTGNTFSAQYPPSWFTKSYEGSTQIEFSNFKQGGMIDDERGKGVISISVEDNVSFASAKEWLLGEIERCKEGCAPSPASIIDDVTINGVVFTQTREQFPSLLSANITGYYTIRNNHLYKIIMMRGPEKSSQNDITKTFNQILSTFTLTDTNETQAVIGINTSTCCGCPKKVISSQIGKDGWVLYEKGVDYTPKLPSACRAPTVGACLPCEPIDQTSPTSPTPRTTPTNSYTCPPSGWVDCMPTIGAQKNDCSKEAMAWYKANCPNFQGGAY